MQMPPNTQHPIMTDEEFEDHIAKQKEKFGDMEGDRAERRRAKKMLKTTR